MYEYADVGWNYSDQKSKNNKTMGHTMYDNILNMTIKGTPKTR